MSLAFSRTVQENHTNTKSFILDSGGNRRPRSALSLANREIRVNSSKPTLFLALACPCRRFSAEISCEVVLQLYLLPASCVFQPVVPSRTGAGPAAGLSPRHASPRTQAPARKLR